MIQTSLKTVGIDHAVLHVSDLARSKRFYVDLLGMTVNHESSWQSFLWCGKQQIALFEMRDGSPCPRASSTTWRCSWNPAPMTR